jgi:hypothetical protein
MSLDCRLKLITIVGYAVLAASAAPLHAGVQSSKKTSCLDVWNIKVQPIVDNNCVVCHQTTSRAGGLSLQRGDAPASLLGVPSTEAKLARVEPGDPAKSYLFHKIVGTQEHAGGSGERMPVGGALTDAEISVIETWITACPVSSSSGP